MYAHDSLTMEFDLTRTNHRKNVLYKISYAKEVLDKASKIYWICDSKQPREHFNYVRLTKLLQGTTTTGWAKSRVPFFSQKKLGMFYPFFLVSVGVWA